MKFQIEETITYIIDADSEQEARDVWEGIATPQVRLPDGRLIFTETFGIDAITLMEAS